VGLLESCGSDSSRQWAPQLLLTLTRLGAAPSVLASHPALISDIVQVRSNSKMWPRGVDGLVMIASLPVDECTADCMWRRATARVHQ
jgi:hypothetical protein